MQMCLLSFLPQFCFLSVKLGHEFSKFIASIEILKISKQLFNICPNNYLSKNLSKYLKNRNSKPLKNAIASQTAMRVVYVDEWED